MAVNLSSTVDKYQEWETLSTGEIINKCKETHIDDLIELCSSSSQKVSALVVRYLRSDIRSKIHALNTRLASGKVEGDYIKENAKINQLIKRCSQQNVVILNTLIWMEWQILVSKY